MLLNVVSVPGDCASLTCNRHRH